MKTMKISLGTRDLVRKKNMEISLNKIGLYTMHERFIQLDVYIYTGPNSF